MDIKNKGDRQSIREIIILSLLLVSLIVGYQVIANWSNWIAKKQTQNREPKSQKMTVQMLLGEFKKSLIFLSVNDEATHKLPSETRTFFANRKGTLLSELPFRSSYVGIIKNGQFIQEKSDIAAVVLEYKDMLIRSGGFKGGSFSQLKIGGQELNAEKRGLNVFVLDEEKKEILNYNFDFFAEANPTSVAQLHNVRQTSLEKIVLTLSSEDYEQLERKRAEALETGILLTDEVDLIPAKITFQNQRIKSEIRLKGDWTDHLIGDNWSFRVKLAKNKTLFGMRKFSLHQPKTRNYAGEWLFHQLARDAEILSLQYHFVEVALNIKTSRNTITKDLGIYALEEFFDKYLIERNQRKMGLILKIDEDPMWEERAIFRQANLDAKDLGYMEKFNYPEAKILPFAEASIIQDANLSEQLAIGRRLFKDYITGKKTISEVFDVPLLAKYNAICNLLGADHALIAHNFRVYYNPISALLEPVAFDGNAGTKIFYPYLYRGGEKDKVYMAAYAQAIEEVTKDSYINYLLDFPALTEKVALMQAHFPDFVWDEKVFSHNQHVLQQNLHPVNPLNVFFQVHTDQNIQLSIENHRRFPLEILSISTTDGRKFGNAMEESIVESRARTTVKFQLNKEYQRLFVNKKKRKSSFELSKDIEKVQLNYRVLGTEKELSTNILPWTEQGIQASDAILLKRKANLAAFDFLVVDEAKKTIICKTGTWKLTQPLIIPTGYTFLMEPGTKIDLLHPDAMIISFSPVRLLGDKVSPIHFTSSSNIGGGLLVLNTQDTSIVAHCKFSQLSNSTKPGWVISGAVNFYQAPVKIKHSAFTNNRCEDALNIISSYFEMNDVLFTNIYADAFDGDFVQGKMTNCFFSNIGNDAIDVSNAQLKVENILINSVGDKGLSAGENSQLIAENCIIKQSEIGVASKDQSTIRIAGSLLADNKLAFTAFQKKSEYGPAQIFADSVEMNANSYDFLIENQSFMKYNQKTVETVKEVKERMYGIEFGKSSR